MFKKIRSFIGKLLPENIQMVIIIFLSDTFWTLRKYFLGADIEYPKDFLANWKSIKHKSSQDRERNFKKKNNHHDHPTTNKEEKKYK